MTTIGFVQHEPRFGARDENLRHLEELVRGAPPADLLVLPELAATGYEFLDHAEVASLAEPFGDGPTFDWLGALAASTATTLVVGYPERDGDRLFNSCALMTPGGKAANYRKIHLFSREKVLFEPGDAPPPVVETPAGRVGLMICYDWLFPETARLLALDGAQILAHPSNLVLSYCQRAMFARCVENGLFAVTSNRIGAEERVGRRLAFTGASQVVGPRGEVLAAAPTDQECVGSVEVELERADSKWLTAENHILKDRRADLYGRLAETQVGMSTE